LDDDFSTVDLSIALVHYPVLNKNGETIASAVTNLDLHDLARSAKTYGVKTFYVATPLVDQQQLARKIIGHWTEGYGKTYNPDRRDALELIKVVDYVADAVDDVCNRCSQVPETVVTSARKTDRSIGFERFRGILRDGKPYLLLFGTAWGISEEMIRQADWFLEPIYGTTAYNHLSVRAASAIILDRLLGRKNGG
jgi:hypothetical protein